MLRMFKFSYFLLLWLLLVTDIECRLEESYVRIQHEPRGLKIVTLMDFERLVNLNLDNEGQLLSCSVEKRNQKAMETFRLEFEERSGGVDIEYKKLVLDVPRYGRECTRFMQKAKRSLPEDSAILRTFKKKLSILRTSYPGTKFCTLGYPRYNTNLEYEDLSAIDICCKEMLRCPIIMSPFEYLFLHLNVYDYHMVSCPCLAKFRECITTLEKEDDNDAKNVRELVFDVLGAKCLELTKVDVCTKYDQWFTTCEEADTEHLLVTKNLE
ncbi:hypothetical protein TCAL_03100 [Tigriopus californicus]|uniref:Phospholipase A2-like central domain-containing protein n=1 Tax=Tigriopus californicus TaxID=6832 RepID=A0A553NNP6_TIGCA|nr:uncharacterized protein LOC131878713 [Tigriopus californicus]TRY67069.1 hypothetical protein TCAL_03100 [Tigriopus californicus]|eukprot:TCALIF_03100-PA protein Name:"Similar to PLA2G3 Group 3 secretory phospholipase A2 (Bos taurus)" AED:0.05 eAED:0.05 QI:35/1/1/1/0/0/3/15/267